MGEKFRPPDFSKYDVELRFENDVVCIYGTEEGLREIIKECQFLLENPDIQHVHLEDTRKLTPESENGAIAIFPKG